MEASLFQITFDFAAIEIAISFTNGVNVEVAVATRMVVYSIKINVFIVDIIN